MKPKLLDLMSQVDELAEAQLAIYRDPEIYEIDRTIEEEEITRTDRLEETGLGAAYEVAHSATRDAILAVGTSVGGLKYPDFSVSYVNGRTSWDDAGLLALAEMHPELKDAILVNRRVGPPTIQVRGAKKLLAMVRKEHDEEE